MSQSSLWQTSQQSNDFAEICNALYERELRVLANTESPTTVWLQGRLKSLPHYIYRTASLMTQVNTQGDSPLVLDVQNASWSAKQAARLSMSGQSDLEVVSWYLADNLPLGLVVPILNDERVILDCIDRVDVEGQRFRTNATGWFTLLANENTRGKSKLKLLKPNKKIMLAACAGHRWQNANKNSPVIPSLRELLLSCAINWHNFHKVVD
jgi:hypothetical protein